MAILDIPSFEDFYKMGLEHIMIGYEGVIDFYHPLIELAETELEQDALDAYWDDARLKLLVLTGLIHEGFDFILKSKICSVSPYLLLKADPKEMKIGKSFSDFLTHGSQDLPGIVNTFCPDILDPKFITIFNEGRKRRNIIRHTYDKNLKIEASAVIKETLELFGLISTDKWMVERVQYAEADAHLNLFFAEIDFFRAKVIKEFQVLDEILSPADFKKYLHAKKKQRFFYCFECYHPDYVESTKTCFLESRLSMKCVVCDTSWELEENDCDSPGCKSTLCDVGTGHCISCGN